MKAETMRRLRRYHQFVGLFFAPAILLFAVSGALQTFRLQEVKGYGGIPPMWVQWIASFHIHQTPPRPKPPKPPAPAEAAPAAPSPQPDQATASPLPLQVFVVLMAIGLILSSALGMVIALTNRAARRSSLLIMAAGAVLPLILLPA